MMQKWRLGCLNKQFILYDVVFTKLFEKRITKFVDVNRYENRRWTPFFVTFKCEKYLKSWFVMLQLKIIIKKVTLWFIDNVIEYNWRLSLKKRNIEIFFYQILFNFCLFSNIRLYYHIN